MEPRFYLFVALLIGVPVGTLGVGIFRNSAGLTLLGAVLCIAAVLFVFWILAQLNTDI